MGFLSHFDRYIKLDEDPSGPHTYPPLWSPVPVPPVLSREPGAGRGADLWGWG